MSRLLWSCCCSLLAVAAFGQTPTPYRAERVSQPPRVDGLLDDAAWQNRAALELNFETDPAENAPADVRTEVFVVYDDHALYVAFRAHDPEPAKIRAQLSDRDQISRNDQVGFVLDTFDDQRRGFAFMSNPLGVQADMVVNGVGSPASGSFAFSGASDEDFSWDAIWTVAGRIDPAGYTVEFEIPFTSLRFPRGVEQQTWSFVPYRGRPRSVRQRYHAVPLERSRNCFLCQAGKLSGLAGIAPGRDIELDPTAIVTKDRVTAAGSDSMSSNTLGQLGLTARWGITPNLTLGAAINPDFSQVEADALQLAVNSRFTLFFPEKRPFFLEGADFFKTPISAVYTRSVVDPDYGVKLTGKAGANALGVFIVRDAATSLLLPSNQGSRLIRLDDRSNDGAVLRWRRDIGSRSTFGLLFTGRKGDDYHHTLGGADARILLTNSDTVTVQYLQSSSRYPKDVVDPLEVDRTPSGSASVFRYEHRTREWFASVGWLRFAPGFRADSGFVARVDLQSATGEAGRIVWGDAGSFWKRQQYSLAVEKTENDAGRPTNDVVQARAQFNGPLQSFVDLRLIRQRELFADRYFDQNLVRAFVNVRWNGAFTSSIDTSVGETIDFAGARLADLLEVNPEFTLNLGRHFFIGGEYTRQRLSVDEGWLFTVRQIDGKVVYQFTPRAFLRAIVQSTQVDRDSSLYDFPVEARSRDEFTQLLFSYKLNPLTVLYLGATNCQTCGALPPAEQLGFVPEKQTTVFFKLGYAWQL
ncbi:MAG: DUF5916 domain-containing protein [Acidobacteriota bacterium]